MPEVGNPAAAAREPAVFVLRHGETEWSVSGRHTGRTDIPLTDQGRRLAAGAGRVIAGLRGQRAPAAVLSSPRQRAVLTAQLAGLRADIVTEDLAEWDYGDYEGLTTPQIREHVPEWTVWTHPCPGGETAAQVQQRADRLLRLVHNTLPSGDVVLVGHGHFSRVLVSRWIGLPATAGVHFGLGTAGVAVLGAERGVPQIVRLNLPPA